MTEKKKELTPEEILAKRQADAKADSEAGREAIVELPKKEQPKHPKGKNRKLTMKEKNRTWGKDI